MTLQNSTWLPEECFSGRERLPASLRGIFMANRDHIDPRIPRDIWETLRKPRSQVPKSPPANDLGDRTGNQSSLELPPVFLQAKWDPQLSPAKSQATAQPQQPRLNPEPWLGHIKPRLFPMAGGSKEASSFPPPQI
ncbi:hypothetical protein CRG98_019984 [Punica granatum]|uniref:Uncharacterized protein n=1 Tax=Punica granatum TaxID=22663 RepID=A0A2I0JTJ9_PUNGR|nr:hypothetical protein CRG98_019984 [Punica granatum]